MSKKSTQQPQYQWTRAADFPGGHRIFRDECSGRYSICDGSGRYPHLTDDGVLWIDMTRAVSCATTNKPIWGLALVKEDGSRTATVVPPAEARWAIEKFGLSIHVGGDLFGPVNPPRIPTKSNVGDVGTVHITLHDSLALDRGDVPFQIGTFEYGYVVLTHPRNDERKNHELRSIKMSEAYIRLLHVAYAQGYYYLMIDRDGPVVEGLDTFKW